jgi:hypothetical protein
MTVRRHFVCVLGNWKIEGWHLYRLTEHVDAKTCGKKARWHMWDKML